MLGLLELRAKNIKERHKFVSSNGWAQVTRDKYPSNEAHYAALVDYGMYRAALDLHAQIQEGGY